MKVSEFSLIISGSMSPEDLLLIPYLSKSHLVIEMNYQCRKNLMLFDMSN